MKKTTVLQSLLLVGAAALQLAGPSEALVQVEAATLYEGARLIVGDGSGIENSAFIVQNGRFSRIGTRGEVQAPAGASRVNPSGKTVMPTIVDTHNHIGIGREAKHGWT